MTEIISEISQLNKKFKNLRGDINFIPTMGNLHFGHESLIKKAIRKNGVSIVSIFVNPLQFTENKDFIKYPRTLDSDLKSLKTLGVDYIFLPDQSFLLDDLHSSTIVSAGNISNFLCGKDRPGHFDGVATIIVKFLNILRPKFIFLGEKDFQQVLIIKKLIRDLSYSTKIVTHKIVREKDGLAFSSRNSIISISNRKKAKQIYCSLESIKNEIKKRKFTKSRINFYKKKLLEIGFEKINYLVIRKEKDLSILGEKPSKCRILISANIGGVRLIDNLKLGKLIFKKNIYYSSY